MGGIIADNVGRSSGLIKGAAAPAGIVLMESGYCTSSPGSAGYTTWANHGTAQFTYYSGNQTGSWGGVLADSTEAITWGSVIAFPSTGIYHIWIHARFDSQGATEMKLAIDDGHHGASDGFIYLVGQKSTANLSGEDNMSLSFGYKVDDIGDDKIRMYKIGNTTLRTGETNGSQLVIAKFA